MILTLDGFLYTAIIIVVLVVVRQGSFSGCLDYYSRISCS